MIIIILKTQKSRYIFSKTVIMECFPECLSVLYTTSNIFSSLSFDINQKSTSCIELSVILRYHNFITLEGGRVLWDMKLFFTPVEGDSRNIIIYYNRALCSPVRKPTQDYDHIMFFIYFVVCNFIHNFQPMISSFSKVNASLFAKSSLNSKKDTKCFKNVLAGHKIWSCDLQ